MTLKGNSPGKSTVDTAAGISQTHATYEEAARIVIDEILEPIFDAVGSANPDCKELVIDMSAWGGPFEFSTRVTGSAVPVWHEYPPIIYSLAGIEKFRFWDTVVRIAEEEKRGFSGKNCSPEGAVQNAHYQFTKILGV